MILKINGDIDQYYVQTLCLLFFPGAKFSQSEQSGPDVPELELILESDDDSAKAHAVFKLGDRIAHGDGVAEASTTTAKTAIRLKKVAVGRAVFAAGKQLFTREIPWGILTGVRPSKVASSFLFNGCGLRNTKQILRDEYFVNPKKAALAVSVASAEMRLTKKLPGNLCSVYISIPFCPTRCAYCSFVSYTTDKLLSLVDDYLRTLLLDIDNIFSLIRELGLAVATVYIGGGTPTVLSAAQLDALLERINKNIDVSTLMEFTVEAGRPDTITEEKLRIITSHGARRISVNPQTLNDELLMSIGRHHTVDQFYRAYEMARNAGVETINVDLIAGLPGDTFGNFANSIDSVIALAPENITVHSFSVKKAADLRRKDSIYDDSLFDDTASKSIEYSQLKTKFSGYKPYYMYRQKNTVGNLENVGYSLEGREGMYNIFMMEELHSVFAVGAGAVTKLVDYKKPSVGASRIKRIFTPKYPYEYLRDALKIREGDSEAGILPLAEKVKEFYSLGGNL